MCMCATYGCIWTLDIVCAYANKKDQNNMWSCAAHLRDCDCMDHTHANTHTHTHTPSQDAMDLPDDKRQVVIQTSEEKKWQMVRDNTRRRRNIPPQDYISKLKMVMELDPKRARRKAGERNTIQALQGLEISLRTNDIR